VIAAAAAGGLIGVTMGMVGGGGAVLALPVLVYALGLGVHEATTASLAVVAAAAATGAVGQARRGAVCWSSAVWFAGAAGVGGVLGTALNQAVSATVLLLAFSAVMVLAARSTWERAGSGVVAFRGCPKPSPRLLVPAGFAIGVLTGLVGVGGGFVVVPALIVGLSFGIREAMGTSMAIVTAVSGLGLLAHLAGGSGLDVPVVVAMGGAAVAGAALGPRLADRVSTPLLGRSFAVLVLAVAVGVALATVEGVGI
jgi:uncharacterized protein